MDAIREKSKIAGSERFKIGDKIKQTEELLSSNEGIKFFRCGSSVTCNPPVENTDIDFLVWSDLLEVSNIEDFLSRNGFHANIYDYGCKNDDSFEDAQFISYRREEINVIIACNAGFAHKFYSATRLATKLNLLQKKDRVTLFHHILYGDVDERGEVVEIEI